MAEVARPLEHGGLEYFIAPDVYEPSDDTFLLLGAIEQEPPGRLLEIGTGAGLVAVAAARAGHTVVATDVHPSALALARRNSRKNQCEVRLVLADLHAGIRLERFDCIAFNPPYLPTRPDQRVPGPVNFAFDGGLDGRSVVARFLERLPSSAPPVLLVRSSLQGISETDHLFRQAARRPEVRAARTLDDEGLEVVRLEPPIKAGRLPRWKS